MIQSIHRFKGEKVLHCNSSHLYVISEHCTFTFQVVVCCVSDQFEQDQKCRDMFLYIKEQLFKKFAIAVIRESMEWKSSELGMKIGQPVRGAGPVIF